MAKNKTMETEVSVLDFIRAVPDEKKQNDALRITEIMKKTSGYEPKMWGSNIIGFGSYHYKYESGHEGDAPLVGFSPRKTAISLYIGIPADQRQQLLQRFGKHKSGKACIYINKLEDIDIDVLKEMIVLGVDNLKNKNPG